MPNLKEEKKLWKRGYKYVAGLDEAGRGPLAGPVVAAAVILNLNSKFKTQSLKPKLKNKILNGIKDSKQLTPKKREELYKILIKRPDVKWGIGKVSEKIIDKINILEATKLAMTKTIKNLEKKLKLSKEKSKVPCPNIRFYKGKKTKTKKQKRGRVVDFLILDGKIKLALDIPQKSIVKADEKVFSCAAASIIAKVARDKIMINYHKKYPQYGFDKHKGYPTKFHKAILKKHGPCPIHRKSFSPVRKIIH